MPRLRTENHHWWPESLSKFWADTDGKVHRLQPDGETVRAPPQNFGANRNVHHIKFGDDNPWNSTFEPSFGNADSAFPGLGTWLLGLDTKVGSSTSDISERFLAHELPQVQRTILAECLASLIARSPCTRHKVRTTTEYYRKQFGFEKYEADRTLVAANLAHFFPLAVSRIDSHGMFLVLYTDSKEFIFGDGFLHNFFPPDINAPNLRCVVPLLPTVAVIYFTMGRNGRSPALLTLRLGNSEINFLNDAVQVYSRDEIFFRSTRPTVIESFAKKEFQQYPSHKVEWLDCLIEQAMAFDPLASMRAA